MCEIANICKSMIKCIHTHILASVCMYVYKQNGGFLVVCFWPLTAWQAVPKTQEESPQFGIPSVAVATGWKSIGNKYRKTTHILSEKASSPVHSNEESHN